MEKKKDEKQKKGKKKLVSFDKIDITTATDDEIIRSGIKHNTKTDKFCYMILFFIVVLAILPVALRIIIPRKATTEERDIVYYTITCYKGLQRDNYELSTNLISNYRDGKVQDVTFKFKYFKRSELAKDGYVFAEIEELNKLKLDGIESNVEPGNATFTIDFENYPELKDQEQLKDYTYFQTAELNLLINEKGYSCSTESDTKLEVVDIETGKKIK